MKTYSCVFCDSASKDLPGFRGTYEARTAGNAGDELLKEFGLKGKRIKVKWGADSEKVFEIGDLVEGSRLLDEQNENGAEVEQRNWAEELAFQTDLIKEKSNLELDVDQRESLALSVASVAKRFEKKGLKSFEIEFVRAWANLKDREEGDNLLLMLNPPGERNPNVGLSSQAAATGLACVSLGLHYHKVDLVEPDTQSEIPEGDLSGSGDISDIELCTLPLSVHRNPEKV